MMSTSRMTIIGQNGLAARIGQLLWGSGIAVNHSPYYVPETCADVVVECTGRVSAALDVAMGALYHGRRVVTASAVLMAVHGQALQRAALGQHGCLFAHAALGCASAVLPTLMGGAPHRVVMAGPAGANAVIARMEQRAEDAIRAEAALRTRGDDMDDAHGKFSHARAVTVYGVTSGEWLAPAHTHRTGVDKLMQADIAHWRRMGLRAVYGSIITNGGVRTGVMSVAPGHPLAQSFQHDMVCVDTAYGSSTFTQQAVADEATARAMVADIHLALQPRRLAVAAPQAWSEVSEETPYVVSVPYAERDVLLKAGFGVHDEMTTGEGQWLAVGTWGGAAPVAGVPVIGSWQSGARTLRVAV